MTVDQLPVVFVRHIMDANDSIFNKWYERGLAVLHYEGELPKDKRMSTDPRDFAKSGKHVIKRLWKYCKSGALIVVDYNDFGLKNFLIGVLPPNSIVEPLLESIEKSKDYPKGLAYYKIVQLRDCIKLNHSDSWTRPLLVLQPRQGNVVHWTIGNIEAYVKNLYKAILTNSPFSSNLPMMDYPLTDYQWEVLCSEYLRREESDDLRIDYLLTPIGRTMKDVDIDGANRDVYILAQVSLTANPEEVKRKIASLSTYSGNTKSKDKKVTLVYFGPKDIWEIAREPNSIVFIPVENVRRKLEKTGILEDMIPMLQRNGHHLS